MDEYDILAGYMRTHIQFVKTALFAHKMTLAVSCSVLLLGIVSFILFFPKNNKNELSKTHIIQKEEIDSPEITVKPLVTGVSKKTSAGTPLPSQKPVIVTPTPKPSAPSIGGSSSNSDSVLVTQTPTGIPALTVSPTPSSTPVTATPTLTSAPTATPVQQPSPTPTPIPTPVVSTVYVTVYQHAGNTDMIVYQARVKVVKHATGEVIGIGTTDQYGRSQTWTVPANTDIDVYVYPPGSPNTNNCGSVWSFNTQQYGNLWSQNMRIYDSSASPCIHE